MMNNGGVIMKKISLFVLLLSILTLVSCSPIQGDMYEVRITSNMEGDVFKESAEVYQTDEVSTVKYDNPIESKIMFGKKEMVVSLTSTKKYTHKSNQNIYISNDKNTEYRKSIDNDSFTIQSKNDTVLAPFLHDTLTDQILKNSIIEYMSAYLDIDILNSYNYSCYTSVVVSKSNASWKETKEFFYLPKDNTESIMSYRIEFSKEYKEFKTSDNIMIVCNAKGDITGFYYYDHNVDWEEASFDQVKIKESINAYLEENLSKDYDLCSYSVESQKLVYLDGEIQLSLAVEISLTKDNEEIVVLCPLLLSNS